MSRDFLGLYGAFSMMLAFLLLVLILTVIFPQVQKLEQRITTPGNQIDGIQRIWGSGPIGRLMRATHVFMFFLFRHFPYFGQRIVDRLGTEIEPIPRGLKWSVVAPMVLFYFFGFSFLLVGWILWG